MTWNSMEESRTTPGLPGNGRNPGPSDTRRAVVIGSGFGGLALAIRLQAAGLQVTILEKRERIGGRAYQLEDQGYVFDMGPSLITAPAILDSVFRTAGSSLDEELELIPLDPYYRIFFHDGSKIDYVGDPERMKAQMRRFDAEDADNFDDFMARVRPIYDAVIGDRLGSKPFDTLGSMASFVPRMMKMSGHRSVTSVVNRYFQDFRHRFMYSFHPLFVGGNPFTTPAVYLMIPYLERQGGVWFTPGGMYEVVQALARKLIDLGGRILTDHEVRKVDVRDGMVRGVVTAERYFHADLVASNADPGHTYRDLVDPGQRKRWTDRKVDKLEYSMSCFLLYIGVRKRYPELAHHTLILTERYQGLVRDIFENKVLPDDFSMYLHVPTRSDPGMAPEGCESMYVLVPVANNRSGVDWSEKAEPFGRRIVEFLEEWGMEDLRDHIDVMHTFTPDDFAKELNALHGNAFSVEPRLTQTAWFRPQNRSEDVEGLYLVGAGTHPGAGVPGVLLSAETTYGCIAEDLGLPAQWSDDAPGRVELPEVAHAGARVAAT